MSKGASSNFLPSQEQLRTWLPAIFVAAYWLTRLFHLTILPVFADESIYIRWAQLITHDPHQYLFFSLNDGKPPLYVWSLIPALNIFADPLWAARFVSALVGFVQLFVLDRILLKLKAPGLARIASAIILIIAPFWFFYDRMALMDGLLTLGISVSWLGLLGLDQKEWPLKKISTVAFDIFLAGFGWGVALWTKTPALFFAPAFVVWAFGQPRLLKNDKRSRSELLQRALAFGAAGILGLGIFALLRIAPAFGSLFQRSDDFSFTLTEIINGQWRTSLGNIPRAIDWLSTYLRPELLSLPFIALIVSKQKFFHAKTLITAAIFAAPLVLLGKVLHPRYFLPIAIFVTTSGALFFAEAWAMVQKYSKQLWVSLTFWLILLFFFISSLRFMFLSMFAPNLTPFVINDREQYLTTWSSGHGIPEVRDMMINTVHEGKRLTVVTEGSFGTLPDGLLLYFDKRPEIKSLRIEGLAQYPVKFIPDWVYEEAKDHPTWLVVNADRMQVDIDKAHLTLIARYPRPYGAPDLQVYEIHAQ